VGQKLGCILLLQSDHHRIKLRGRLVETGIRELVVIPHIVLSPELPARVEVNIAVDPVPFESKYQVIQAPYLQRIEVPRVIRVSRIPNTHRSCIATVDKVQADNVDAHSRETCRQLVGRIRWHDPGILARLLWRIGIGREYRVYHEVRAEKLNAFSGSREIEVSVGGGVEVTSCVDHLGRVLTRVVHEQGGGVHGRTGEDGAGGREREPT